MSYRTDPTKKKDDRFTYWSREAAVEFRVLGSLEVRVNGSVVDVGAPRQRCLLAALLVDANRVVTPDQLVDRLWGDNAPPRARPTLRAYLSRLRHALAAGTVLITRRTGGYVLTVEPAATDVHQFRALLAQVRVADDETRALTLLDEALALWRGEPLAGLDTPWIHSFRQTVEAERTEAERSRAHLRQRRERPTGSVVPMQLPLAPQTFTGRHGELDRLTTARVPTVVFGAGGIGKSWLAQQWAHHNAHHFPEGQLFVDLRGRTGHPIAPATAVGDFLAALGVPRAQLPAGLDARVGLYRSLVAGRRMIVVLDNAHSATQVAPLLPASPTCAVVVTSRTRLPQLVPTTLLALDVLPRAEAYAFLVRRLGRARVAAEPDAVEVLLTHCAGLPLVLAIVSGWAATHPHLSLTAVTWPQDGPVTNLAAVLAWSVKALDASQAKAFDLLGLAPGPDIGLAATASLTGTSVARTRELMRVLVNASLVDEHLPARWRMHDLVRPHAANRARRRRTETPLRRLVGHYVDTAAAAARLLVPHRPQDAPPLPGCQPAWPFDRSTALAWFTEEHANLLASQQLAAEHGWHQAVRQLARALM